MFRRRPITLARRGLSFWVVFLHIFCTEFPATCVKKSEDLDCNIFISFQSTTKSWKTNSLNLQIYFKKKSFDFCYRDHVHKQVYLTNDSYVANATTSAKGKTNLLLVTFERERRLLSQ